MNIADKERTISKIYKKLQNIDMMLEGQNQDYTRSLVRMAHVSLAMAEYGIAYETGGSCIDTDMMVAALKGATIGTGSSSTCLKVSNWQG